jgi:hypothetical protein
LARRHGPNKWKAQLNEALVKDGELSHIKWLLVSPLPQIKVPSSTTLTSVLSHFSTSYVGYLPNYKSKKSRFACTGDFGTCYKNDCRKSSKLVMMLEKKPL